MEHDEKPLPIDIRTLGQLAEKVGLFRICRAQGHDGNVWGKLCNLKLLNFLPLRFAVFLVFYLVYLFY